MRPWSKSWANRLAQLKVDKGLSLLLVKKHMTKNPKELYLLCCLAEHSTAPRVTELLQDLASWGWQEQELEHGTEFLIHVRGQAQGFRLKKQLEINCPDVQCAFSLEVEQDWTFAWRKYFHPVPIEDKFLILPSWEQQGHWPGQPMPIYIEPQMAFGTGHHTSTTLCLQALVRIWKQSEVQAGDSFLDLGTGSGILALACVKLGLWGLALDNDPQAVQNAVYNKALNRVEQGLLLGTGELSALKSWLSFELILANILASPLVYMAQDLCRRLKPGGRLILSGLMQEQESRVLEAYQAQGLQRLDVLRENDWSALILERNAGN